MRSRSAWAVCGLLLAAPAAADVLLERVLAVVEGRPVLLSEVRLLQSVRGVTEKQALEELIDERLMLREAGRLAQSAVAPEEEERALARLTETSPAARAASAADLRRLVRRQTAILKYIDFRFRPQVSVSDDDVRRAWEQRPSGGTDVPTLDEASAALRRQLEDKALDERIEAWVAELRAAADVRYN
jgi:hypothetical protein